MPSSESAGQVAVITGAGEGLAKACAELLASKGASVVVNDASQNGQKAAAVATSINQKGGKAISSGTHIRNGDKVIAECVAAFGAIHILIIGGSNVPKPEGFEATSEAVWTSQKSEIKDRYTITNSAWKIFRKQGYGRIVNISSIAAIHGLANQSIYSAAQHSQISFTLTLAKEGARKNVLTNIVLPFSSNDGIVDSPSSLDANVKADNAAAFIAYLAHAKNKRDNGSVFELGPKHVARLRWQRSKGLLLRADESLGPGIIIEKWPQVISDNEVQHPDGPNAFMDLLKEGQKLPSNSAGVPVSFKGRVVLITGAGAGLGRAYALHFARLGASLVINDIVYPGEVVKEIQALGAKIATVVGSAVDGEKNISAAIEAFGRIDVVINNAGIVRDAAFHNMKPEQWDAVFEIHAEATYRNIKAAWPHFKRQKYGRVVNTTSVTGIYGNFGQANYGVAKAAIIGLTRSLAAEGLPYNIFVSVIAPNAGTNMTKGILSAEDNEALKPDHVAPLVSALTSDAIYQHASGGLYETGSGWFGRTRWERQLGDLPSQGDDWTTLTFLESPPKFRAEGSKALTGLKEHIDLILNQTTSSQGAEIIRNIDNAKKASAKGSPYTYTERDLILYALSVGAKSTDLPLVYENHPDFAALPAFGLIPFFNAEAPYSMDAIMRDYSLQRLLHIDQYLEIRSTIPTSGTLKTFPRLIQVVDKGKDALVVQGFDTKDDVGNGIFYNETTLLIRRAGGFGGNRSLKPRAEATALNRPPSRAPDVVLEEKTSVDQAALYRLNGDYNPLHIDPDFSSKGGFAKPILHGLCTIGIVGRRIAETYGPFKVLKSRLAGIVLPGQTLRIEMWKEKEKVVFTATVVETGKPALGAAAVVLGKPGQPRNAL